MGISRKDVPEIKTIIALGAFILILLAPGISEIIRNTDPIVTLVEEDPIQGETGYDISRNPHSPTRSLTVYNGSIDDSSVDWQLWFGHFYTLQSDEYGVTLELEGHQATNPRGAYAGFYGTPTLPVLNYTQVTYSVNVKVLRGSANTSLRVTYGAWPDYPWMEAGINSTFLVEGETGEVVLSPPLSELRDFSEEYSSWILRPSMFIEVVSSESSLIQIGEAVIKVESNEDLYPVTFDVQAPDGESLFLNPYTNFIGPTYHYFDTDGTRYPAIKLTRTGNISDSAIFGPRISNETIYISEGTYEGTVGWFYNRGYSVQSHVINISFSVEPDESVQIFARIPTSRLYIDIVPDFAYSWVRVSGSYYELDFPLQDGDFLYLPGLNNQFFSISVRPLRYESHRFVDYRHYNYRIPYAGVYYEGSVAEHNYRVTISYSQFSILGVIVDWGYIIGFVGAVILFLLLIQGGMTRSFAGIRTDYQRRTNLIPVILYYSSVIFPWVRYTFETDGNPPTAIVAELWPQLYMTTWTSQDSQVTFAPSSYLLLNIGVLLLIYWIPLLYLSYLITTRRNSISDELFRPGEDLIFPVAVVAGPFILGIYYLWLCMIGLCAPNIGLFAVLLTTPSWSVSSRLRKHRKEVEVSMKPLEVQ